MCSEIIDKEGETFLETAFPEGISGELKKIYMSYVCQQLLIGLSANPRFNHDYLGEVFNQVQEELQMVAEEPQEEKDMP
jgi:hypothetical protein